MAWPQAYGERKMRRRRALARAAAGLTAAAAAGLSAACGSADGAASGGGWLSASANGLRALGIAGRAAVTRGGGEALVSQPARQLALALADLPPGFRIGEEMAPSIDAALARQDPWGRVSAYAVTFVPERAAASAQGVPLGEVVSSVNAYVDGAAAAKAFAAWRDAVPATYHAVDVQTPQKAAQPGKLGSEVLVYARDAKASQSTTARPSLAVSLVGLRSCNVMASVSVTGPVGTTSAPVDAALRLARVMAARIEGMARR